MKIRHAAQADLQGIAAIHAESWKDAYAAVLPTEFFAKQIDIDLAKHWSEIQIQSEDLLLVAEEGSLVGFAAIWCRPIPFIDNLHVKPSCRSKGIGSALMKAAAKELIDRGNQTAYLWVFESNKNAIRFYERLGGVQKEQAQKAVFGHKVLNRKIVWDDLGVICTGQ